MTKNNLADKEQTNFLKLPLVIFITLSIGVIMAGYLYYVNQKDNLTANIKQQISAIADLKVKQIVRWRKEIQDDTIIFADGIEISEHLKEWFEDTTNEKKKSRVSMYIKSLLQYRAVSNVELYDPEGKVRFSSGTPAKHTLPPNFVKSLCEKHSVIIEDLQLSPEDSAPYMYVYIPLNNLTPAHKPLGIIKFRIDPREYLYPLIQTWPTPSETAETLLVRREGDHVVFLNELRHQKGTALKLKFSSNETDLPAARVIRGEAGVYEGIDYRGKLVLAATQNIPDSPWFIVSKIDQDEIFKPINDTGRMVGLIILIMLTCAGMVSYNILKRQQARALSHEVKMLNKINESEMKFGALFENMTEGVAWHELVSDASGSFVNYRILNVNPAFEKHTGLAKGDVCGKLATEAYGDNSAPFLNEFIEVATSGKPCRFDVFFPPLEKHFSISAVSCQPNQFTTVFEDITDRKRKEEQLQQKNEETERITYAVSHDLKSPLVTIQTFTGYLEQDLEKHDQARVASDFEFIRKATDKMNLLLNEILELSRVSKKLHPKTYFTLQEVAREAADALLGPITTHNVKLSVSEQPCRLFGDRVQISRVFQNLLDNAIKFMGQQPHPQVEIGFERKGNNLAIFLRDNGMGIDPKYQKKLFNLFEKLNPEIEGTGMGLTLVKRIVEQHGGKIWIESKGVGEGTTVYFVLEKTNIKP